MVPSCTACARIVVRSRTVRKRNSATSSRTAEGRNSATGLPWVSACSGIIWLASSFARDHCHTTTLPRYRFTILNAFPLSCERAPAGQHDNANPRSGEPRAAPATQPARKPEGGAARANMPGEIGRPGRGVNSQRPTYAPRRPPIPLAIGSNGCGTRAHRQHHLTEQGLIAKH